MTPGVSTEATYWDYIGVEKLLSLVCPVSNFPSERPFIVCHQITELLLHLMLKEIEAIHDGERIEEVWLHGTRKLLALSRLLTKVFSIVIDCVKIEEFSEFRKLLKNASGFQSFSFRKLELKSTSVEQLCPHKKAEISEYFVSDLYWVTLLSADNSPMISSFLEKYRSDLDGVFQESRKWCLNSALIRCRILFHNHHDEIIRNLRQYDTEINLKWRDSHRVIAQRYIDANPTADKQSTGQTSWKKYLSPLHRVVFFPDCADANCIG